MKTKHCPYCQSIFKGRENKKFCTIYCKSLYNYYKDKEKPTSYMTVLSYLKRNREILLSYYRRGATYLELEKLKEQGFHAEYHTHKVKLSESQTAVFNFEFGCIYQNQGRITLVVWQDYMNKLIDTPTN